MHLILSYIKFLLRSTNQHGVHSPFVYSLVTRCFYDKTRYPAYNLISAYRKKLLGNTKRIKVTDLGAGSRVFTSEERKVSAIAKKVGITPKRARLLNRMVRYLEVENALELGTSLGIGTAAMAAGHKVQITTLEGCPATAAVAARQFNDHELENIELKVGEFDAVLKELTEKKGLGSGYYSLIFFDGNHRKEATLQYFEKLLTFAHNDSVFIFDDIHWSKEMEAAWERIKAHPSVKVSIDTFYWGMVFFRREQEKEHFVIRV